jgi:uncharacterized membrane protein
VVEDHGDGQLTILVPWAPTPFAGSVKLVEQDKIEMLKVKPGDFTEALSFLGLGVRKLLGEGGKVPQ